MSEETESLLPVEGSMRGPCMGCGYMIRGGDLCGDCREYGPPKGWRWQYDESTETHSRLTRCNLDGDETCGDPDYCREHGCQL